MTIAEPMRQEGEEKGIVLGGSTRNGQKLPVCRCRPGDGATGNWLI